MTDIDHVTEPGRPIRRVLRAAVAVVVLAGAACDLPTTPPRWDTRWVVPAETMVLSVDQLIPSGMAVTGSGSAFSLAFGDTTFSYTLSELCGTTCDALDGMRAKKPAFTASFDANLVLPNRVVSLEGLDGTVGIDLTHGFSFDPLRPSDSAYGWIATRLTDGADGDPLLARDSINGRDRGFPPGTTFPIALTLEQATVNEGPVVQFTVDSPEGDTTVIDTSDSLTVAMGPDTLELAAVTVEMNDMSVETEPTELGLAAIENDMVELVRDGAFLLDVQNEFDVTGTIDIAFETPDTTITKQFDLETGTTSKRIDFTGEELRTLLADRPVNATLSGTVAGTSGTVTIRPADALVLRSRLELTIGREE